MRKFKVITLCGSTKFKEEFIKIQNELTLKGIIVISLGVFSKDNESIKLTKEDEEMLREMHKQKIIMSDEIFVINKNGYIGDNTANEIAFARQQGKLIKYLEPLPEINKIS